MLLSFSSYRARLHAFDFRWAELGGGAGGVDCPHAVCWARVPRVVLPDRALCLPIFCHSVLTVNKSSSSSSSRVLIPSEFLSS